MSKRKRKKRKGKRYQRKEISRSGKRSKLEERHMRLRKRMRKGHAKLIRWLSKKRREKSGSKSSKQRSRKQ